MLRDLRASLLSSLDVRQVLHRLDVTLTTTLTPEEPVMSQELVVAASANQDEGTVLFTSRRKAGR